MRISKFKLQSHTLEKLFDLFFTVVLQMRDKRTFDLIALDILSPTEKIMVAKRIMLIYLLMKNIDYRSICMNLKVSSATVSKYRLIVNRSEGVVPLFKKIIKKEKMQIFLEEVIATLYEPGTYGVDWNAAWAHKKSIERRKQHGF